MARQIKTETRIDEHAQVSGKEVASVREALDYSVFQEEASEADKIQTLQKQVRVCEVMGD